MNNSTWYKNTSEKNITHDFTSVSQNCWRFHFDELPKTPAVMASIIGTSILHIPSSIFAVFSNAVVMYTIMKKPALQTSANLLILSMCFSDFLVGLTVQPLKFVLLWVRMYSMYPCTLKRCFMFLSYSCCGVSLLNAALVTMDRYFSVCKPYLYIPELIKGKYVYGIAMVWLLGTVYPLLFSLQVISKRAFQLSLAVMICLIIIIILSCYRKIYVILRQHQRQIASQRLQAQAAAAAMSDSDDQEHNTSPSAEEKKRLNAISIIVVTLLLCYLPYFLFPILNNALKLDNEVFYILHQWARMLVFLNSCFNPIIYCVRVATIAEEVKRVLKRFKARILCEVDEL